MYLNDDQNYMILILFQTEAIENTHPCYSSTPTPTFVLSSTEASTAPTTPLCNL